MRQNWQMARGFSRGISSVSSSIVIDALRAILGDRVSTSDSVREHHSHGESWHAPGLPDAVVFPASTEEVSQLSRLCARHRKPIVAFGMGSSLEGHVNAIHGGVSIDLTRMTRVLRLSPEDLDITVEAGLTRLKLDAHLKNTGLMFPIDPGADATIGGMAATRASGTTAVRYGTMRENVLGLTVVLADGSIIKTGGRARKSSSGYDLTRLFVGSEGTLGVITEVTLRLYGRPEAVRAAVCPFESMEGAANTVIQTIQLGIPGGAHRDHRRGTAARGERVFEDRTTRWRRRCSSSSTASARRRSRMQIRAVEEIAREHGAKGFKWASSLEDRNTLWQARHNAYYATVASRPGARAWTTDICVPISHLAECIRETQADIREANVVAPLVGHAGDGNFHLIIMLDPDDRVEFDAISRLSERLVERALKFGGTCSGEHGVGIGKLKYLEAEHGDGAGRDARDQARD